MTIDINEIRLQQHKRLTDEYGAEPAEIIFGVVLLMDELKELIRQGFQREAYNSADMLKFSLNEARSTLLQPPKKPIGCRACLGWCMHCSNDMADPERYTDATSSEVKE